MRGVFGALRFSRPKTDFQVNLHRDAPPATSLPPRRALLSGCRRCLLQLSLERKRGGGGESGERSPFKTTREGERAFQHPPFAFACPRPVCSDVSPGEDLLAVLGKAEFRRQQQERGRRRCVEQ